MANTRYRRGGAYAADMAVYARAMAADNSAQLSRVKRNLVRALREFVIIDQGDDGKVVGNRVVPLFAHLIEEKGILMIADDKAGKSPPGQKIGEVHIL